MESKSLVFRFPQELLNKIICEIGNDRPTLRSCAIVCHAFLPSSQSSIFSEIHLLQKGDNGQRLYNILVNAQHLLGYVRAFILTLTGTAHEECYPAILGLLPAVSSFSVSLRDDFDPRIQHWSDLSTQLRAAICDLCQRSDLVSLRLSDLGAFTDLAEFAQLVTSPALAELTLHQITLPVPKDGDMSLRKQIGLNKLVFDLKRPTQNIITHWLVEGKSLSNLRRLCVSWSPETVLSLREFLNVSSSLEDLRLESWDVDVPQDHWNTLSFAKLKRLGILEITVAVDTTCGGLAHLFARLLESCSRGLVKFGFSVALLSEPPAIEWQPLRDMLTTVAFPALARVDFWASTIWDNNRPLAFQSDHPGDKFLVDFQHGLYHLAEQGILNEADAAPERSVCYALP
ncbi:hypothetical protein DFH06DRAFT_144938 [Mycena polygramma]|nr:hypothetical protein DFH06DRAFT_144938 [Mycena polygramma]